MAALPSLTAIRAAHRNNPDGKLVQTDSDRIAWMDGLPVGTFLTITQQDPLPNVEAERIASGWRASFYYNGSSFNQPVATWREVVDLMADPPQPPAANEPRESWEQRYIRDFNGVL